MQLGDSVLEEKMSYKYLGLEVRKIGSGNRVKQGCWRKREKEWRQCALGIRRQGLSVKAAVRAWEALVLPILEYACEIWAMENGER